jgi:hypothetical protein
MKMELLKKGANIAHLHISKEILDFDKRVKFQE